MAAQTGRTVSKWVRFVVKDSGGTLREVPINSLSVVGLAYDEQDLTAWQDAIKGALPNMPDAPIEIGGPLDSSAATTVAASGATPTLSGSHTVLAGINGLSTPLSLGVYFGVRHNWETGEPTFGITSSATAGYICTSYTVNPADMTYKATFKLYPGSTAPAWGTAVVT